MHRFICLAICVLFPFYLRATEFLLNYPIHIESFNFKDYHKTKCQAKHCLSLDDLISYALSQGFETREQAQHLSQARYAVGEKLGLLFPSFNFNSIVAVSEKSLIEVASSLLGFIFPSHWYQWKESKYLAQAEKESYKTFLANRLNEIQNIYHNIHLIIVQDHILSHYHSKIKKIIRKVIYQKEQLNRELDPEQLGILYTIRAQLSQRKKKVEFELKRLYPQIAYAIAYDREWAKIALKKIPFEEIGHDDKLFVSPKILQEITDKSTEIKTIQYLKVAAGYAKKSYYVDFISPRGQGNLGVGYKKRIKIAKSKIHLLEIQAEKAKANLKLSLHNAIYKSNEAVRLYRNSIKMQVAMEGPMQSLIDNILNLEEVFDIEKALRFFDFSLEADTATNLNWHLRLIAQNHLDRLLWKGHKLDQINFLVSEK